MLLFYQSMMISPISNRGLYKYWKKFKTIPATSYITEYFKHHQIQEFIDYAIDRIDEKITHICDSNWMMKMQSKVTKYFGSDCLECALKDNLYRFCSLIQIIARYDVNYINIKDINLTDDDKKLYYDPLDNSNNIISYTKQRMPCNDESIHYEYLLECVKMYKKDIKHLMETDDFILASDIEKIERKYMNLIHLETRHINDKAKRFIDELKRLE